MKDNVGKFIQDTSSAMATLIGTWINDAYQDAWRRGHWNDLTVEKEFDSEVDKEDYSFSSDLSVTDFGKDLYLTDITNGKQIRRFAWRNWWRARGTDYSGGDLDSGNPGRYIILTDSIRLDPPPDAVITYSLLYQKTVADLSADDDTPAFEVSAFLEKQAKSTALAYKRQYQKASWWANQAEFELKKIAKEEYAKINQIYQRKMYDYGMPRIKRLLGDKSYDTI